MTERQMSARERLLERARTIDVAEFDEEVHPADDTWWDEAFRRQRLNFMQVYDSAAALQEELLLRLMGEGADGALFPVNWNDIISRVQTALQEFTEAPLHLRVAGYSTGSTVVHLVAEPSDTEAEHHESLEPEDETVDHVHQTPLADASMRLMKVLCAAELRSDLRAWSGHLEAVEKFSEALHKRDLSADVKFLGSGGKIARATLTRAGMDYLEELQETKDVTTVQHVSGRIVNLSESGLVRIKAGVNRNSKVHDVHVDPSEMIANLHIGQQVHWEVRSVTTVDRVQRTRQQVLQFKRVSPLQIEAWED